MWDYLKKYKNNHTTSSLSQTTRSNASLDKRIWIAGPPTLNPLNWHCFGFALGHHLFQHPLSPYDEKSVQDVDKLLHSFLEYKLLLLQPLHTPGLCPYSYPTNLNMRSKKCTQTNRRALLVSLTECYKLVTLISKDSFSSSSTVYGNFTPNLQTGNFLFYNPHAKDTTKTKQIPHPTEVYI